MRLKLGIFSIASTKFIKLIVIEKVSIDLPEVI